MRATPCRTAASSPCAPPTCRRSECGKFTYKGMPSADYVLVEVERHRHRHSARHHRQDLRAVLLDQGGRQGHRPRPVDGLRHRQADRRLRLCEFGAGQHGLPHFPAAPRGGRRGSAAANSRRRSAGDCRRAGRCRRRHARPQPISPGRAPSFWSRTRRACARSTRAASPRAATRCSRPSNGVEAIEVLEKAGRVDLVVSDVVMPEMDGPTLLKELRRRDPDAEDHLRVGLCRGGVPEKSAGAGDSTHSSPSRSRSKQLVAEVKKTLAK